MKTFTVGLFGLWVFFFASFSALGQTCKLTGAYYVHATSGYHPCVNSPSTFTAAFTPDMRIWVPLGNEFNYAFSINVPGTISTVSHTPVGPQVSITFNATGSANVSLIISDNCGNVWGGGIVAVMVTNQPPTSPVLTAAAATACTNSPVNLRVTGNSISRVRWRCAGEFDGTSFSGNASSTIFTRGVVFVTPGVKTVFADVSNGCGTVTVSTTVTVTQSPNDLIMSSSGADKICTGTVQNFSVPFEAGVTYQWSFLQGGGSIQSNTGNAISVLWNQVNTSVLRVTATRGACTKTSQRTVTVTGPSSAPPNFDTQTEYGVCLGPKSFQVWPQSTEKDIDWTISGGGRILSKFLSGNVWYLNVFWEQEGCHTVTCVATDFCGNIRTSSKQVCVGRSGEPTDRIINTMITQATTSSITVNRGLLSTPLPYWYTTCGYVNRDPSCLSRKILITASLNSNVTSAPVDRTQYTANATFGAGSDLGGGNFVVYSGAVYNFTGVTIQGLNCGTSYHLAAYEYDEPSCGNGPNYAQVPIRISQATSQSPFSVFVVNADYCSMGYVQLGVSPTAGYTFSWTNGGPDVYSSGYYTVSYSGGGCSGIVGINVYIDWNSCNSGGGGGDPGCGRWCPRVSGEEILAYWVDQDAQIEWHRPANDLGYELQRSIDGDHFERVAVEWTDLGKVQTALDRDAYQLRANTIFYRVAYEAGKQNYESRVVELDVPGSILTIVSPNPAREAITVVVPNGAQATAIRLLDTHGRVVEARKSGATTVFDVRNFQSGLYFVRVDFADRKPDIIKVSLID